MTTPEERISAQEDRLFDAWRRARTTFNPDGVVDEERYASAPIKLLFLLKETNKTEAGFDLRTFLAAGDRPQTWNNVARWTEGIFRLARGEVPPTWDELRKVNDVRRAQILRHVCAVNLKKSTGVATANNDEFRAVVEQDADWIRRQLALYTADITVCCGSVVSDAVLKHRLVDGEAAWTTTSRGVPFQRAGRHGVLIDYSHPEARIADNILVYGLLDAVSEIGPRELTRVSKVWAR